MRGTWSAKRVFAVVAVMWLAVAYVAYAPSVLFIARHSEAGPETPQLPTWYLRMIEVLSPLMLPTAHIVGWMIVLRAVGFVVGWSETTYQIALAIYVAFSAACWATIITVAFVLIRHLRERRAASKEA